MSYTHRAPAGIFESSYGTKTPNTRLPRPETPPEVRPQRARQLTRRYEASWLTEDGNIDSSVRIAPAIPLFEEAFSAFARGSVIVTEEGPVAVEDLVPGMRALTADGRVETITWIGSMMLYPGTNAARPDEHVTMTRITVDAFGQGRPMPDLVLGPRARLCLRDPRLRQQTGLEVAYVPARTFVDGVSVIEVTPVTPVAVYHVVLERQGSLRVAGLEVESYHPGEGVEEMVDARMLQLFLAQFPQIERLSDFGPMTHPRLTRFEVEALWD